MIYTTATGANTPREVNITHQVVDPTMLKISEETKCATGMATQTSAANTNTVNRNASTGIDPSWVVQESA